MKIRIAEENGSVVFYLEGQLDTVTFSELEEALNPYLEQKHDIVLDFAALDYISSAGLRVILRTKQRTDDLEASLVIRNSNEEIMEVFDITGFADFLTFE